ncbi:MAG: hypothetical protein JXA46_11390 [Dehalococcoidales bacterium]|nr:hypothetical protein [Dehalococcoidales bacterium]
MILVFLFLSGFGCSKSQTGNLPPTPSGWTPESSFWIPPLPRGLDQPYPLSDDEWKKVLVLAGTDPEVIKQTQNNNISSTEHYWVGYSGKTGAFSASDSRISSGKSYLPAEYTWYYPMIVFNYSTYVKIPVRFESSGRKVGVDINTGRIIFSCDQAPQIDIPEKSRP